MTNGDQLPYAQVSEPTYAETAAAGATVRLEPDDRDPERILIDGTCARCAHPISFRTTIVTYRDVNWAPVRDKIFNAVLRKAAGRGGSRVVTVHCRCGEHHPGGPMLGEGCGAYWNVTVEWGRTVDGADHAGTAGQPERPGRRQGVGGPPGQ